MPEDLLDKSNAILFIPLLWTCPPPLWPSFSNCLRYVCFRSSLMAWWLRTQYYHYCGSDYCCDEVLIPGPGNFHIPGVWPKKIAFPSFAGSVTHTVLACLVSQLLSLDFHFQPLITSPFICFNWALIFAPVGWNLPSLPCWFLSLLSFSKRHADVTFPAFFWLTLFLEQPLVVA